MSKSDSKKTTETATEEANQEPVSAEINPVLKIARAFWNIELLEDSQSYFGETNWYYASVTTFHIGVLTLIVWSAYILFAYTVNYLASAGGTASVVSGIVTVGPLTSAAIFIFAILSKDAVDQLEQAPSKQPFSSAESAYVFCVSLLSLVLAWYVRYVLFHASIEVFGPEPSGLNVVSIMLTDGLYLGLLLIGIGGTFTLIFTPTEQ